MDVTNLLSGFIGAVVGSAIAWLAAWKLQGREFDRNARDAGRAVFFELMLNRSTLSTSVTLGALTPHPLSRSAFDSTMPQLAGWLEPSAMLAMTLAYIDASMVGTQYNVDEPLPEADLAKFRVWVADHTKAIDVRAELVFDEAEKVRAIKAVRAAEEPTQDVTSD